MPANENEKLEMPELTARSESGVAAHKIVYTGVFTAIYFVVLFAIGMLGFFGPQFMLISFPLVWLINGTVIILMLNKIRSFGALTFLGIIIGSLMVLTGHAWTTLASTILTSLIADLLSRSGNYTNSVKNIFSYGILQLWYIGPLLPIFYAADSYYADIARQMGQAYADQMRAFYTPEILGIFAIAAFIISLLGGWVGVKVLHKHFNKAGIA